MFEYFILSGFVFLAYLVGSVPTSVWYGKSVHDIDVRDHGSGNAGATNTFRVLGKKAGSIVMAVDVFKGVVATSLPWIMLKKEILITHDTIAYFQIAFGLIAVLGHVFPILAGFKGGKGVATLLGMVIALHPLAAAICVIIFLIILLLSKYVSLGSMIAALCFPIMMALPFMNGGEVDKALIYIGTGIFILVVYTHRKNIVRLWNGEENKTYLIKNED